MEPRVGPNGMKKVTMEKTVMVDKMLACVLKDIDAPQDNIIVALVHNLK